jgi:hypothetical protein
VYTNPATQVPPLPSTYSSLEMTLDMTAARVRTSDVVNPFGAAGNGFSPRQPNVALHYTSGATFVEFSATPTRGASPLAVQFSSRAVSGNPGGILAYAWDFDNDGVADSALPNPSHVYTACGNDTVSLTIVDTVGVHTVTSTDFVRTDVVVPSFTSHLLAATLVQFTDTSSPPAQTWAWDLDGDGLTDSTVQNPVFQYPSACDDVNVSVTMTRACQPPVTLNRRIAVADNLETTFAAGLAITATAPGGTNFLDVDVADPMGISVCGMHFNSNVAASQPVTINVHVAQDTYVGKVENAALWRLAGTAVASSRGPGGRTFVSFQPPIYLTAGRHGLGIEHVGASPMYTNLGAVQTYSNADLSITAGLVQALPIFGPAATSTQFTPRVWSGALQYSTCNIDGEAGYGFIGAGCPGSLGVPGNTATAQPRIGTTANIALSGLAQNVAFLALGFSRTLSSIGPLPLDLGVLGAPGCAARVSIDANFPVLGAGNVGNFPMALPNTTSLLCVQFFTQGFSLDSINALGLVTTDAAAVIIGQ